LSYALTYISRAAHHRPSHSLHSARLTILADNDYYSQPSPPSSSSSDTTVPQSRFAAFPTTLPKAHKTGLGSSAALVTSLAAALLTHYLDSALFDLASDAGRRTLHNLAQAAHCAAQGKVGSGFDVAAAVHGSCLYRRFSPAVLAGLPEPGMPDFGAAVVKAVESEKWDTEIAKEGVSVPRGVAVRMCDVDCGSATVGMVKTVLAWRGKQEKEAKELWDALQGRNDELAGVLREGKTEELAAAVTGVRELVRKMGQESETPIEPPSQTELLDALGEVEGVYGGVVPGAGGFDALALLVKDDEETARRVAEFVGRWSKEKDSRVRLLSVKGEMEGVRMEDVGTYKDWIS
jgi:phosphomevalonate kinase